MSFEIFLSCFENGRPAGIDRRAVRSLFPVTDAESGPDHWKVQYGEREWCHISVDAHGQHTKLLSGLTVLRPCKDVRLWHGVLDVMKLGNVVLYWPGDHVPLVANESVAAHLPADMVEALGKPVVVSDVAGILGAIRHS